MPALSYLSSGRRTLVDTLVSSVNLFQLPYLGGEFSLTSRIGHFGDNIPS